MATMTIRPRNPVLHLEKAGPSMRECVSSVDRRAKDNRPRRNQHNHYLTRCHLQSPTKLYPGHLPPQSLPAKNRTNPVRSGGSVRNAICWIREDSRTIRRGRSAEYIRRRVRQAESPGTEGIPIDLAQIIADLPISCIRIFELQDIARSLGYGNFQRVTSVA